MTGLWVQVHILLNTSPLHTEDGWPHVTAAPATCSCACVIEQMSHFPWRRMAPEWARRSCLRGRQFLLGKGLFSHGQIAPLPPPGWFETFLYIVTAKRHRSSFRKETWIAVTALSAASPLVFQLLLRRSFEEGWPLWATAGSGPGWGQMQLIFLYRHRATRDKCEWKTKFPLVKD